MRAVLAALSLSLLASFAMFACDSSVRVGELRPDASTPVPLAPPPDVPDAGTRIASWRMHTPNVPCTIYAMDEIRSDDLWIGCDGGRIYRFDGVRARLAYEVEDASIFSLLWVAPDGQVWAGAQESYEDDATTQLHHFDGTRWSKVGDASKRIVAIGGAGTSDVWLATETQILRREGGAFVPVFTAPAGSFRACTFSAPDHGTCVGTSGLAVAWNGTTWSAIAGAPWSASAEVFGVEHDTLAKKTTFFYGEPIDHPNGDHSCRMARETGGAFTSYQAALPCFARFRVARRRTGTVSAGGRSFMLLAVDENYGGALVFDPVEDTVEPLCGPVLAFSTGSANTRAGGLYGLLATLVGAAGNHLALSAASGSSVDFGDLSVAPDGTGWARVEDTTACGSITDRLVRFEDGAWAPVAGPQGAQSGRGLAAASRDHAYTTDFASEALLVYAAGGWTEGPKLVEPWSLWAAKADDVWIGGAKENFGHYDGKAFTSFKGPDRRRQVEQILGAGPEVWMVLQGVVSGDTDVHVVRWAGGELTEWNDGIAFAGAQVTLAALDEEHVYRTGVPAQVWDGARWKKLGFDANGVWPRSPEEVYFTDRGDIWKWDGRERTRVFHGFVPITAIAGAKDHAFAVGPGGLTLEFAEWPDEER
jgi:hypothetical protein